MSLDNNKIWRLMRGQYGVDQFWPLCYTRFWIFPTEEWQSRVWDVTGTVFTGRVSSAVKLPRGLVFALTNPFDH